MPFEKASESESHLECSSETQSEKVSESELQMRSESL
jgi:hypothetical protein